MSGRSEPIDTRVEIAKQVRLWVLSLICASAGAATVYGTGSLVRGIGVFLIVLVVLGPLLLLYEKKQAARRRAASGRPPITRRTP